MVPRYAFRAVIYKPTTGESIVSEVVISVEAGTMPLVSINPLAKPKQVRARML